MVIESVPSSSASLPWYDFRELRGHTDALWASIARRLRAIGIERVPIRLRRDLHHDAVLLEPSLLLSQTCGLVVAGPARAAVRVLATPRYSAPGCEGTNYRSFVVVRREHADTVHRRGLAGLRGSRAVINEPRSHSGTNALRATFAKLHDGGRFFGSVTVSGSHERSLQCLVLRRADVAAVDCVTFELLRRFRPALLRDLCIVATTDPAPAPPFVTAADASDQRVAELREVLAFVLASASGEVARRELLLEGVETLPADAYDELTSIERRAIDGGYVELPSWRARDSAHSRADERARVLRGPSVA